MPRPPRAPKPPPDEPRGPRGLPRMSLAVERPLSRVVAAAVAPRVPERFPGLPTMEDRPLYEAARAVLRRTGKIKVRTWVQRMAERPEGLDAQLEHKVPQFFLRNIARAERKVEEDESPYTVVALRDRAAEEALAEIRNLRYRPPALLKRWNMDDVLWLRALLKRFLHQEDWRRRFGRELKETVRGPLYKYDPDAPPRDDL
jgi:hypothetical protein